MSHSRSRAVIDRLSSDVGAALLLVGATVIALLWANSPASSSYVELWETHAAVSIGSFSIDLNLHHWINDGLMILFFFMVGLEVREELSIGSLTDRRRAVLPLVAGIAGVVVPALVYVAIAGREAIDGWGVVVGTDTAFLLGVLALVGPRLSNQLRIFLLTLTVVDDFLAVSIIGFVYSDDVQPIPLAIAGACIVALWALGRSSQWRSGPYVFVIVILWAATLKAGIHPSIAGMIAGLLVPAREPDREDVLVAQTLFRDYWQSPQAGAARNVRLGLAKSIAVNERLIDVLRTPVALLVVPLFALANAGVDLRGGALQEAASSSITWGVVGGLVLGKFVGISLAAWLAIRAGWGKLPDGVGPGSIAGGAALSGIGFTVSLLIVSLALEGEQAQAATVGVLIAMVLASLLGWLVFRVARVKWGETTADLPTELTAAVDPARDHILGGEGARHTVVEYSDFECPFCAKMTGMGTDLKEHFGEDLRFVVRHLPVGERHPRAFAAAVASEAAGRQGKFWEMHHVLFEHQAELTTEDLFDHARDLGLDLDRFAEDVGDPALAEHVQSDLDSALASGATGTPTFFLDGHRHTGPHDARTIIAALEASATVVPRR